MIDEVTGEPEDIIIGATGLEEIFQNVRMILTTPKGTVPLDRDFGLSQTFLDQPTTLAKAKALPEIIEQVEKYEPRVKVTEVVWVDSGIMEGKLVPLVRIRVTEDVS